MKEKVERVKTTLEIDERIDLHVVGWIVQRIGWGLMLVCVALAALGLFGNGVLSHREVSQDRTTIAYERFARRQNSTEVRIKTASHSGHIVVTLSERFLEAFKIEHIVPEPSEQRMTAGSQRYIFSAEGEGQVTFFLSAQQSGDVRTEIAVGDIAFSLHTYIYP